MTDFGSVNERLSKDTFTTDEEESHISIDQELARLTGDADMLCRICPAHVYSKGEDGSIQIEYAACLECGTCLAMTHPGVLQWHYPRGGMGVSFREG
ncbi:ferredoxin family protein [Neoactinobaculum massilliense]|uniref:ferredoxin family protein n=1 Tax=Neoactinobaculum massilliense TaxID=2364794 RepID=UPI000F522F83|nr:4Fe-4S dicluster domain-containing protein [Neoactinobaculum massilliense]